ncbi:MAG: lytic transglycosylase domain-containing protein [Ginsengibacter sp.]
MKTIQSKSLLTLIIIFFIIGFSTSAKNFIVSPSSYYMDTITNESLDSESSLYLVDNPDRVIYPEILEEHRDESEDYVERYSKREREYIIHMFKKGKSFFPKADVIFTKYDVPQEFRVLPALESNFSPSAVSPAGAVGYWQFMGELAREYGLRVGGQNDERKNFTKSTVAAAKFFRDQLDFFNDDILLTVAAYNCGQGRVRSSLKKTKIKNPDYWDIKEFLPAETRRFVMKFVSLNVIAANYDKFLKRKLDFDQPNVIQIASIDSCQTGISVSRNAL